MTEADRKWWLAIIANYRHCERNRLTIMLSILAGFRVGEIAPIRVGDTVNSQIDSAPIAAAGPDPSPPA